SSLENFAAYV
nr:Chain C, 10-mer peptide from RNA-directed RNA polymerase subunit P2 [synthetic construct]